MPPDQASRLLDLVSPIDYRQLQGYAAVHEIPTDSKQVLIIIHKLSIAMILMQEVLGALRSVVSILNHTSSETVRAVLSHIHQLRYSILPCIQPTPPDAEDEALSPTVPSTVASYDLNSIRLLVSIRAIRVETFDYYSLY